MKRLSGIAILIYATGIFLFHVAPTTTVMVGDVDLNRLEAGSYRATHFLHAAVFFPWGLLGAGFVYGRASGRFVRGAVWIALGLLIAVGAEGIQYWLPHRGFSLTDIKFNLAGVALGAPALLLPWSLRLGRERGARDGGAVFR